MTPKERHFEFMKAVLVSPSGNCGPIEASEKAVTFADAALEEFKKRWPEEENKVIPFAPKDTSTGAHYA